MATIRELTPDHPLNSVVALLYAPCEMVDPWGVEPHRYACKALPPPGTCGPLEFENPCVHLPVTVFAEADALLEFVAETLDLDAISYHQRDRAELGRAIDMVS